MNENVTVVLNAAELGRAVRSVLPARSKDFGLPGLLGLHLWVEGGELWAEATNRYTIARHRVNISSQEGGVLDVSVELVSGLGGRLPTVGQEYPNLQKIFPSEGRQDDVPATVAWDVRRLDELLKCVKALDPKGRPRFNMAPGRGGQHGCTLVTLPGHEGWSAAVMPLRIDS